MVIRTFDIYEGDTLVFRGTTHEVALHFGGGCSKLYDYARKGRLWRKKYTVKVFKEQGAADLNEWDVVENGKTIFTGTDREIAERFGLCNKFRGSEYWHRNYRILHRYHVEPCRKDREQRFDEAYSNMVLMLKEYHNYYVRKEPEKVAERLKKDGINVEIRNTSDRKGYVLWQV